MGVLINAKSEFLERFKRYKVRVEKESGKVLKILRTDVGGEYTSHAFKNYCQTIESRMKLLHLIRRTTMAWSREEIAPSRIWQDVSSERRSCHRVFGQKLCRELCIY